LKAVLAVERLRADGGTNTMDGLHAAYGFTRGRGTGRAPAPVVVDPKWKAGGADVLYRTGGADTVYLLTDGKPNMGAVPEPVGILDAVRKINAVRRVRVHVIGVGAPGRGIDPPDPAWCRRLAEENGGTFKNLIRGGAGAVATP
jgi:hypothetical protein